MQSPPKRILSRYRLAMILLTVLLVAIGIGFVRREAIRRTLFYWTGEEDFRQQIKGTLALVYLRLTQPPPRTEPLVPIRHAGVSPYGVNTFLEQEVEIEKVDRSLQMIADAGFTWIRQQFPWEDIEISGKGDFWDHKWDICAWAKYDRIVDLAEKHGLQIIARLDNPPAWSRQMGDAPGWSLAPPDNYEDFGDFVYAVVSRYKGRIRYYQIWNEPNIYPEWGDQPADPAGYVELLKVAYRRAKEADPDCVIIAAGLAQTTEETPPEFGPRNMSDLLYLEKMYEAGLQGHMDVMGAMLYGLWTGPYDRRLSRDRTNVSRVELIREIMVRHGDGDKAIWAMEMGWNALPEDFPGFPDFGRVSEAQQAAYAVDMYRRAMREWPWMGVINYWFFRRPSDAEKGQTWYYFRMVEPDFTPLPVYHALAELANEPPIMSIGYHQEDHWALHYTGPWQLVRDEEAVLGAYQQGDVGAELRLTFNGTDLALVLRDPDQAAHLEILINDEPGRPFASHASVPEDRPILVVAAGLPDGDHTAHLRVHGGPVGLDGFIVQRREKLGGLWAVGGAGLILLGVTLGAMLRRRRRHG